MKKSVCFLMMGIPSHPTGGLKVVLEYANYLAKSGFEVHIVYSATLNFQQEPFINKLRLVLRYPYVHVRGFSAKVWFGLEKSVKEHWTFSLNQRHVPKTDFYVATARQTSIYLKDYDVPEENKLYLIQGFENWDVTDREVYDTYRFGLKNIVVSNWLKDKVEKTGANCVLIKNGFDFNYFRLNSPIESRSSCTISMLYHKSELKGCKYGLKALSLVRAQKPQLKGLLFGTEGKPEDLPEWIEYYCCPDRATLNYIYNTSSIYVAPSLQEGWGLTVGEAMICGNAIVCTDTLGFQEMVTDGKEGIIVPTRNSLALANAILAFIDNPELRVSMAQAAVNTIQNFKWDTSFRLFESMLK